MRKLAATLLLAALPARADELSLYLLNNMAVQYEGTGHRETPSGWELKVKPQSGGQGLRWRRGAFRLQAWRNNPAFFREDGNSAGLVNRQTGQTRLSVRVMGLDVRLPLAGARAEAVAGLMAVDALFERAAPAFNGAPAPSDARERLLGAGPAVGLHGRAEKPWGRLALWADAEAQTFHYVHTRNRLKSAGGSIRRGGFGYAFRAEAGVRRGRWRLGVGLIRQMHELLVPGGQDLPNGAAASLPINKIDIQSPFVSLAVDL